MIQDGCHHKVFSFKRSQKKLTIQSGIASNLNCQSPAFRVPVPTSPPKAAGPSAASGTLRRIISRDMISYKYHPDNPDASDSDLHWHHGMESSRIGGGRPAGTPEQLKPRVRRSRGSIARGGGAPVYRPPAQVLRVTVPP